MDEVSRANQPEHELKIWPEPFEDLISGRKKYEIRKADRLFAVNHTVWFRVWNPETQDYTGDDAFGRIVHLTPGGKFGLPADLCVFGVDVIE